MALAERVMVVGLGRPLDSVIEDIIESEGHAIKRVASVTDAFVAAEAPSETAVAVLVRLDTREELEALLTQAADRLPEAKFLIYPAKEQGDAAALVPTLVGPERTLCVSGEGGSAENIQQVRRFLRGEGYRWASDLAGSIGPGVQLLRPTGRRRREDEANKLLTFVSDVASNTEVGPMLQRALGKYLEALHCDAGSIYVWDEQAQTLVLVAAEGPEQDKRLGLRQKLGEGLAGWVAQVQDSILVTDARKLHILRGRASQRYSSVSCLGTPIMHGERLFGVVCLTRTTDEQTFEAEDLLLAQSLSQKLGSLLRPLSLLSELHSFNDKLVEVIKACSDWLTEKDTQVEAMRALSSDILDGIPLGVVAYDRSLRVGFSNLAAQELIGEQLGSTSGSAAPLEGVLRLDGDDWRGKLLGVVQEGRGFRLHRVACGAGNDKRLLDVHCSPLHDSAGATIGGILTVQDVTEDVEMEAKLSSAERLALVGKIAARVAHELNNPLDGILRFLSLAMRLMDEQPQQARSYLEESRRGLMRMGNILTQLLAFSRTYRGSGHPIGLGQIIRESLALYEKRAQATNIQMRVDIAPDLPACPDTELCQVISNVVKNALDAMGQDGVLDVRAVQENGVARITISDTGPGVPEEIRDKIFEPFFTTKKDGTGTGLGLAACVDSLSRIGGEIRLVPSERGATFEITVPIRRP